MSSGLLDLLPLAFAAVAAWLARAAYREHALWLRTGDEFAAQSACNAAWTAGCLCMAGLGTLIMTRAG